MAEYDGLPLDTPTKIRETSEYEVWATRTANGGYVEVRPKAGSRTLNQDALQTKATQALATNASYVALPDPSAANTAYRNAAALVANPTLVQLTAYVRLMEAQIKALSQQNNALVAETVSLAKQNNAQIRLAMGLLSDISDT